jgi:predicted signal transduction protein with EAL and GGDEF domain
MPIVQAAIVRAVSVLGDSLGVSTLAGGQTSARLAHVRSEGPSSVQGFCSTQAVSPNVSFCNHSAPCKRGRELLMAGFLRGMR